MTHRARTDISCEPGTKAERTLRVIGGTEEIPFFILRGVKEGKTVLITAGIHPSEYVGMQAVLELQKELETEQLRGSVILVPLVNQSGFENRMMSEVYEDGKNLNRVFPGRPNGSASERIAWTVVQELQRHADYYIDLHSGSGFEELYPYVYYANACEKDIADQSRQMAMQTDLKYAVASNVASGGSYNYAASQGIPSILIERGCMGRCQRDEIEADKKDVRNILRYLGVLCSSDEMRVYAPTVLTNAVYPEAEHSGYWYPFKNVGEGYQAGEILGEIHDYYGRTIQQCVAKQNGILLYQVGTLNIKQGEVMLCGAQKA